MCLLNKGPRPSAAGPHLSDQYITPPNPTHPLSVIKPCVLQQNNMWAPLRVSLNLLLPYCSGYIVTGAPGKRSQNETGGLCVRNPSYPNSTGRLILALGHPARKPGEWLCHFTCAKVDGPQGVCYVLQVQCEIVHVFKALLCLAQLAALGSFHNAVGRRLAGLESRMRFRGSGWEEGSSL